ncbi:MAG: hypothetical protein KF773_31215 [Deltaproteobacteria bacterium]|nr:hypothetical protein [Deltaproteobacteria bacterium]
MAASGTTRRAVTRSVSKAAVRRHARTPWILLVLALTGGLAGVWTFVAKRQLAASIYAEAAEHLDHAEKAFSIAVARRQAELQSNCRVLVEDPRLKHTLGIEGIDEDTVADILVDLARLRGAGFLMVLSPEARVFAQAGAAELRGLDLSDSSIVKKARAAPAAVAGSWVIAGRVMDLSIMAMRFGSEVIAFLVVGQALDASVLQSVAAQTGVDAANALAGTVQLASSAEAHVASVLSHVAADTGAFRGRILDLDGTSYVTAAIQLGESAQSHRLVLARSLTASEAAFSRLGWLLFIPSLLVIIAVIFSMSVFRRTP